MNEFWCRSIGDVEKEKNTPLLAAFCITKLPVLKLPTIDKISTHV